MFTYSDATTPLGQSERAHYLSNFEILAIRDERPEDATEVLSFMGLVQYCPKFTSRVASIAKPLDDLTRNGAPPFKRGTE